MSRRGENIRKRNDGRWEGRYIKTYTESGKAVYKSVYGKTYAEVKKKLFDISNSKFNLIELDNKKQKTYREILYLWLNNNQVKLKEQTYVKYRRLIETHIIPNIGNVEISKIDTALINRFILTKSNQGRLDSNGGLSPSYVRTIAFILRSSITYASQNKYCLPLNGTISLSNKTKNKLEVFTLKEQI